jgi:hypothetical protein
MMRAVSFLSLFLAGCSSDRSEAGFEFEVKIADGTVGLPTIDVAAVGATVESVGTPGNGRYFSVHSGYESFEAAIGVRIRLESQVDFTTRDVVEVKIGACNTDCACEDVAPIRVEVVEIGLDANALFLDATEYPSCVECIGDERRRIICAD